jgi:hypothetical protein
VSEEVEDPNQLKLFMSPKEIMQRNWSKTEPRPRSVDTGKRVDGGRDELIPVTWVEPKGSNHDLFYKGTHGQFGSGGSGGEHVGRSEQLKMFMTPREVMEGYGPHDADKWITATHQPDGIGRMGDRTSQHPLMLAARPEEFGLVPPYSAPEFEGRKSADEYTGRWHAAKEKFERGEELNTDEGDAWYEAGDPAPGTRAHTEYFGSHTEGFTDREDYLDQWMGYGGVGSIKEEMAEDGFAGSVDDYIDLNEMQYYDGVKSRKKFNLEKDHDPSTWFEDDPQYWDRTLEHAKKPTDELRNAARAEGEPHTMSLMPEGIGAFARVEGMGVEDPVTLGTTPEVNVRGQVKRPIWEGEHDLISAYNQKPDDLIPVQHTGQTGSYGSYADAFHPHAKRQEGAEAFINSEQDEISAKSDIDRAVRQAHLDLQSGEGEKSFWDVQPPNNLPGQQPLFD